MAIVSAAYAQYDASLVNDSASSCVCTTVPCPVNGYNYLSVGKIFSMILKFISNNNNNNNTPFNFDL